MLKNNEKMLPTALEAKEVEVEAAETEARAAGSTRREFLGKTLAVGAGVALGANLLPQASQTVEAQSCSAPVAGQPLVAIGEIKKMTPNAPVAGLISITNSTKTYLGASTQGSAPVPQSGQMRFFTGYMPGSNTPIWPLQSCNPAPGPTIRARVGDRVEITLLNQVNVKDFGDSLDRGETGDNCDVTKSQQGATGGTVNTYPGDPAWDEMPNCYHGSSTANLHYHGTHVSPNVLADNIFVQLRPSPRDQNGPTVNRQYLQANNFYQIFTECAHGHSPQLWTDLPPAWQRAQQNLLQAYDRTAVWHGQVGALPKSEQLWPKNQQSITDKQWPQYYVGAYPSCFQPLPWNGRPDSMGQAPGTHWYHAHKHGSTSINLADGMAGAFIIEGDYDDKLRALYNRERVMVIQAYAAKIGTLRPVSPGTTVPGDLVYVNGQFTPIVDMRPGEVQLWRIVNATSGSSIPINGPASSTGIKWIQTAQDGVQLAPDNYQLGVNIAQRGGGWTNATLTTPMVAPPWFGNLAAGNRVDLLVQAPTTPGSIPVTFGSTLLFTIQVGGTAIPNPIPFPPNKNALAPLPGFLNDLDPSQANVHRDIRFKATSRTTTNPPSPLNIQALQTINGHLFHDDFDQTMELGAVEEWTLYNENAGATGGGPAHPFHIHVNPFQIIEILNPKVSKNPIPLPTPWIWWDNVAIPPPAIPPDGDGKTVVNGYIKMLSHFTDFTGAFVLHCHILDHEDRGMMQMVQVVTRTTNLHHH
jgi:FtsP/CotA-like multicopper oxidase with cupredoxin domain